jgi:hypothetical protein
MAIPLLCNNSEQDIERGKMVGTAETAGVMWQSAKLVTVPVGAPLAAPDWAEAQCNHSRALTLAYGGHRGRADGQALLAAPAVNRQLVPRAAPFIAIMRLS